VKEYDDHIPEVSLSKYLLHEMSKWKNCVAIVCSKQGLIFIGQVILIYEKFRLVSAPRRSSLMEI
jgi:hypothetical protein